MKNSIFKMKHNPIGQAQTHKAKAPERGKQPEHVEAAVFAGYCPQLLTIMLTISLFFGRSRGNA